MQIIWTGIASRVGFMVASPPNDTSAMLPDPGRAGTVDELIERLRALRIWAGEPSYAALVDRQPR